MMSIRRNGDSRTLGAGPRCAHVACLVASLWFAFGKQGAADPITDGQVDAGADARFAAEFVVYPVRHVAAADLEQVIRKLLGEREGAVRIVVDAKSNQILFHGPIDAQRIVSQLIQDADKPPASAAPPIATAAVDAAAPAELKTYRIAPDTLPAFEHTLRAHYAGDARVRIAAESRAGLLFVYAPPRIQREVQAAIPTTDATNNEPRRPVADPAWNQTPLADTQTTPATARTEPIARTRTVSIAQAGAEYVVAQLRSLLGDALREQPQAVHAPMSFVWTPNARDRVTIALDPRGGSATLIGPSAQVDQIARLLSALDSAQASGGGLRVMRIRESAAMQVRKKLDEPAPARDRTETPQSLLELERSAIRPANASEPVDPYDRLGATSIVRSLFTDAGGAEAESAVQLAQLEGSGPPVALPPTVTADEMAEHGKLLRQLGLNVDVEVLPDLDVIILRGRDDEVERVAEIIREIERLADQAEAKIEVIPLAHARAGAIATMITSLQTALLQGRQGRASVMSLETPNALLLIGWGEALEAIRGLIEKLDAPIAPAAELKIFRLRHANAAAVQQEITQFFAGGTGLTPMVRAISDLRTNALIVHAAPRDMLVVAEMIEQLDVAEAGSVERVRIFKLSHTLANDIATTITSAIAAVRGSTASKAANLEFLTIDAAGERMIKSGVLDNLSVTPNTQTNSLVVTGPSESMDLVAALIDQLDQPTSTAQIKVFRIINGDANSMVLMLRSLLPTQTGGTARPQLAGAEGESSLAPLRFSVERRTNSIIATGSPGDLRIVEALLMRLDENEMKQRETSVVRLKNAPATDVAVAINEFLRNQQRIQALTPGELSPFEVLESEVVVVPEPVSNTLIVSATSRFYQDIIDLINRLDAQPPQVMIQVVIAEVALGDVDEFGVELGLQDSVLFDRSLLGDLVTTTQTITQSTPAGIITDTNETVLAASNEPGFNFNNGMNLGNSASERALANAGTVGAQGLSNFAVGRVNNDLGFGGLVLSASSESVSVLVRALQETRRLDVLSRPQIMTLDNQSAFVQVGQRVPRIVSSQLSQFGQINTVELEDVGLILGVTPRINEDGMVIMEVDAEKSEVGPDSEGIPVAVSTDGEIIRSPRIDITSARTTVSAADGETIVLGGLITTRNLDVARRVPLLSSIPLLGELFRYDMVDTRRAELLIILTPHVILTAEDAERLKHVESARMSWCAADVNAMISDTIYESPQFPGALDNVPIIYPDQNPRGVLEPEPAEIPNANGLPSGEVIPPPDAASGPIESGAATRGRASPASSIEPLPPTVTEAASKPKRRPSRWAWLPWFERKPRGERSE